MTRWAHFNPDGVCEWIVTHRPDDYDTYEVEDGLLPDDIWLDGETVRLSQPLEADIPKTLSVSDQTFNLPLPEGTLATVNGNIASPEIVIDRSAPGIAVVDVFGSHTGAYRIEIRSYEDDRRDAYPPVEEQLDALWKGMESLIDGSPQPNELRDMLKAIRKVKADFPKTNSA